MTIKVGQITDLQVARYCSGMGVHMLGFTATPLHPSYVSLETYLQIREWVTGPLLVLEFFEEEVDHGIREKIEAYRPDFIECPPELLSYVSANCCLPILVRFKSLENMLSSGIADYTERIKFIIVSPEWKLPKTIQGCPALLQVSKASELDSYRGNDVCVSATWTDNAIGLYEALERLDIDWPS